MPRRPRRSASQQQQQLLRLFQQAKIIPECKIDLDVQQADENRWAMRYLKTHNLMFLLDPDPEMNLPVYPQIIRSFYHTLTAVDNPNEYEVVIAGVRVRFSTAELCFCLGFPLEYDASTGFKAPITATKEQMIEEMCQGQYDRYAKATRRAYLPQKMWMLDDAIRKNLCPIGHAQQRRSKFLATLYYMYKGTWFDIGKIYMASILKAKQFVEHRPTKVGTLYFPRLITRLLRFKGIRPPQPQQSDDYPVTKLDMGIWSQSTSNMRTILAQHAQASSQNRASPPLAVHLSQPNTLRAILGRLQQLEAGQQRMEQKLDALIASFT